MPQMAPIKWLILFLFFSLTFIVFSMMTFYSYTPPHPSSSHSHLTKNINSMNWKW